MELSKKERLAFIYQFRILEALYPDEADGYSMHRKALEQGYTLHYDWMAEFLYPEMSKDDCRQVLDILDMYRAIKDAVDGLDEGDELKEHRLAKFPGFDGNHEVEQMSYVRYVVTDLERFTELNQSEYPYFDSHFPMLETYKAMLLRWRPIEHRFRLNREQLVSILGE